MVALFGSIWTTVSLSVERFLASSGRIKPGSPVFGAAAGVGVVIWAVVYTLPQFFAYRLLKRLITALSDIFLL